MVKKSHTEKTVGPWAKQKLDALQRYLEAYMLVMKNQRFRLFYVDAFAGAGIVRVREGSSADKARPENALIPEAFTEEDREQLVEYIAGSPLRALRLERQFDHYRFVELDSKRAGDLKVLGTQFPNCDVKVHEGEANERVQFIASHFNDLNWRGVAFLDPYGAHLHWATLEALAATGKFDVVINFPLGMTINRLIKRDQVIPENWQAQLDMCFGCQNWRDVAFKTETDLLGEVSRKRDDAAEYLLNLYVRRLADLFGNVATPSLVRNTRGAPLYYLIWASSNPRGKKIANHILGLGEKVVLPERHPSVTPDVRGTQP